MNTAVAARLRQAGVHAECWMQSEERLEAAVFSGSVFSVQAQEAAQKQG